MPPTDPWALGLLELALILATAGVAAMDARLCIRERSADAQVTSVRGDKSVAWVVTIYGASVAAFVVPISNAMAFNGHKVLLILIDYACITYILFFSSWFRNRLLFRLLARIKKD